jgi:TolA-binding protein
MLRARKKLTKQEMKEDKLLTWVFEIEEYVSEHVRELTYIAGGVILTIAIIIFLVYDHQQSEKKASFELRKAETIYESQNYVQVIEELKKIVEKFGGGIFGTKSAGIATFYLANAYYFTGDYDNAIKHFEMYIDNYDDSESMSSSSLAGIASCWEQKKDFKTAGKYYEKAADKFPKNFDAPQNLLNAGRCYMMAQMKKEAKEILEKLVKDFEKTQQKREAEIILAQL